MEGEDFQNEIYYSGLSESSESEQEIKETRQRLGLVTSFNLRRTKRRKE
jgi:hypothetical protein